MKQSRFKEIVREEIIKRLRETTVVDKTTDPNKAMDIARRDKKDVNTVKQAIQTAKTSGKAVNIDEGNIATDYQFQPNQLNFLKSKGVKSSTNGSELYIPVSIYDELNTHNSSFKQDFIAEFPLENKVMAQQILTALKKSINLGNNVNIKGNKYFILKGHLTKNNNFNFPNPFRIQSGTYKK